MLVSMNTLLQDAKKRGCAVGAFNVPTLEAVRGVVAAAEAGGHPVILQHAELHDDLIPLDDIGPILIHYARKAAVPVAVHYDHGASFDMCVRAMKLGFNSVMYDASAKSFEDNTRESAEIVKIAHAIGVTVEAELGHVFTSALGGGEGRGPVGANDFASLEDCYTNPADAKKFVEATKVDALAIAFGTTHGVYLTEPKLNLERIAEIRRSIDIPFVMHGGSGVSEADYRVAIKNGIAKINYYTYMAMAGGEAVAQSVTAAQGGKVFFHDVARNGMLAMQANAAAAMNIFSMRS